MLRKTWITLGQDEYVRITNLLPTIFPPEELAPRNVMDDIAPYLCFYDDNEFIGFAQILKKTDLQYLMYMAMLPQFRSKGYGGQMLELILKERGNVPLALDVETLDETAENYEQRVRRVRFYLKHGLVDSGYVYEFNGNPFTIMSTGESTVPAIMRKYCAEDHRYAPGVIRIYKRGEAKNI